MKYSSHANFTIFAHVYYPDVWEEMVESLDMGIRQPFDLVITRPAGSRPVARPKNSCLRLATELEVDNQGRDVLPFLTALKQQPLPSSGLGLKLHTKRSPHRSDGEDWRRFLVGSLLKADNNGYLLGHMLLEAEPHIGLVAPHAHLLSLDGRTSINTEVMARILRRMDGSPPSSMPEGHRFSAGSMFWFRHSALKRAIDIDFTDLFANESDQLDGTAAHAFERLFAFISERKGFITAAMENAEPILRYGRAPLSRGDLIKLIEGSLSRDNPFTLPFADFWRRHSTLLSCAHAVYTRLPKSAVQLLRKSIGR